MAGGGRIGVTMDELKITVAEMIKGLATKEELQEIKLLIVDDEKVAAKVAELLKDFDIKFEVLLTDAALEEKLKGFVTVENFVERLTQLQATIPQPMPAELITLGDPVPEQKPAFNSDWLKGLTFRTSEPKTGGGFRQVTRALRRGDVLDYRVTGNSVVIVANDGQKHTVGV